MIFIDTPGMADGDLKYKFDVEGSVQWLSKHSDLILVFLDPHGQALCKKTMNLLKALHLQHPNKINFYMTKGDIFESDEDRYKCMCQIT